jgi:hypothetical protein
MTFVLFFIEGQEVYILRVRGQAPVQPDELGIE